MGLLILCFLEPLVVNDECRVCNVRLFEDPEFDDSDVEDEVQEIESFDTDVEDTTEITLEPPLDCCEEQDNNELCSSADTIDLLSRISDVEELGDEESINQLGQFKKKTIVDEEIGITPISDDESVDEPFGEAHSYFPNSEENRALKNLLDPPSTMFDLHQVVEGCLLNLVEGAKVRPLDEPIRLLDNVAYEGSERGQHLDELDKELRELEAL